MAFGRHTVPPSRFNWAGLGVVVLAHLALLALLLQHRIVSVPKNMEPLFVHFVAPKVEPPRKLEIPPEVKPPPPPAPPAPFLPGEGRSGYIGLEYRL